MSDTRDDLLKKLEDRLENTADRLESLEEVVTSITRDLDITIKNVNELQDRVNRIGDVLGNLEITIEKMSKAPPTPPAKSTQPPYSGLQPDRGKTTSYRGPSLEPDLAELVTIVKMTNGRYSVRPKRYLGVNWDTINKALKPQGYQWVSAGKEGRWEQR